MKFLMFIGSVLLFSSGCVVGIGAMHFDRQDNIKKIGIENGCANYDPIDGHFYWHKALPDLAEPMPVDLTPKRKP